ncbi:hypothetical protein BJY00DRAFT_122439 [Aspergillus carlsbadensis]|nr:hypothetical protein BJY00DRAFT_122439 [Aspergillus carlsbadensis]
MATGIEIVGIVLAALPFVFEGLEIYQRGIRKLKRSATYDISLKRLLRQVNEQKVFLDDNMQKLLITIDPDADVSPDSVGAYWSALSAGETGDAVKLYLGDERYRVFEGLVGESEHCLAQLLKELDRVQRNSKKKSNKDQTSSNTPGIPLWTLYNTAKKRLGKHAMYLIKEDDIKQLTADLDAINRRMDRLLANTMTLRTQRESRVVPDERKARALAAGLAQIKDHTDQLFRAFHAALAPGCHSSHDVALFLDTPALPQWEKLSRAPDFLSFRILLAGGLARMSSSSLWHEAQVTVRGANSDHRISSRAAPAARKSTATVSLPSISISCPPTEPSLCNVADLCSAVTSASQAKLCLHLYLEYGPRLSQSDPPTSTPCGASQTRGTTSLKQLLLSQTRISPREKVKLAFKVATALLQLRSSQWLQASLSSETIHFQKLTPTTADAAPTIDMAQPLVLQSFHSDTKADATPPTPETKPRVLFLELGILLLEIWNETLLACFAKSCCGGIEVIPAMMRPGIANEWYEHTCLDIATSYGKVIHTCLNFPFSYQAAHQRLSREEDEDMRKFVCAKIIAPLGEQCAAFPQ